MNRKNILIALGVLAVCICADAGIGLAAYLTTGTATTAQGQPGLIGFSSNYTVRVMVWDADDRASSWSAPFAYATKPGPWPQADFTFTPSRSAALLPMQFVDASLNSPTSWLWNFGDGQGDTTQNPQHTYAAEGSYSVTLYATNAGGMCSVTKNMGVSKPIPTYREVRPGQQSAPNTNR